ncbi:hypothetical protein KAFR_0C01440 [Kazachstania africana CBS 2517]|uniref:non-specific serine/threonine protein kinase n=1 Tax=Kazachstania africana (strain ATCC 22294 / BCRC 22015 / CBS 2517 / CECT 1963 / NBRC 1671 / NRRL Y-8276) TaxID=1071382 RepID=H2ARY7_KAZAF|nr:hypothetical protein KAFR_0C01440 [Kazachstania africana CBS 2517]CCF57137.1 hypothetical protein KAFR_0C01440 [Kazachstania africana CBS 2517]
MVHFVEEELSPTSRPLLPSDKYRLNNMASPGDDGNISPTDFQRRSSSNRNMYDLFISKSNPTVSKALTDTDNFIEDFNRKQKKPESNDKEVEERGEQGWEIKEKKHRRDDSIEDISDTTHDDSVSSDLDNYHGMSLDPSMKKKNEEWAEKGAAKIVKEVTDPKTGEKTKKIIKKGIKDFKFGEMLGDGAYSTVMLATSIDSKKQYAVKVLNKEYLIKQKKVKYVNIEKNALQRINNSKMIVKLFFTFQDESSLYFLLEYCPNGDFLSLMKKYGSLNETVACYYSAQVIDAIDYLHTNGIIHRDIKPENILLDKEFKIKLTDFGTAKILDSSTNNKFDLLTRSKSFVGTAEYVAPELLNDSFVDYRCDVWAFGCILYQMIAGKPPFKATNEYLTFQKVMKVQYAFTAGFPLIIRDLVKKILVKDLNQRPSISQIEKHHFFREKNFQNGSVWSDPVPEISGFKISAKSMQPIPELNKRNNVTYNQLKKTHQITSTGSTTSSKASTTGNQDTANTDSNQATDYVKRPPDERTAAILENARRNINSRREKFGSNRSVSSVNVSGATVAASAALNKKNHPNTNTTPSSSNSNVSSASSIPKPHLKHITTSKSPNVNTSNASTPPSPLVNDYFQQKTASNRSTGNLNIKRRVVTDLPPLPKRSSESDSRNDPNSNSNSNITSTGSVIVPSATAASSLITPTSLDETEREFVPFLVANENILIYHEFNLCSIENTLLEKRINKCNRYLIDPQPFSTVRSTLLSQVARNGGDITGFRSDSHSSETDFYKMNVINYEHISEDYKTYNGDFTSLCYDDDLNSQTLEEKFHSDGSVANINNNNTVFSDKFKKLFHHTKQAEFSTQNQHAQETFNKRMVVITTFGRLLILLKRKINAENDRTFDLYYDIDLCHSGLNIKEISMFRKENDLIVLQTPYKSFLLFDSFGSVSNEEKTGADSWFTVLRKSIRLGKKNKPRSSHAHHQPLSAPTTPRDYPSSAKQNSPSTLREASSPPVSPILPTPKLTSFSKSINTSKSNRTSRIFDSYVHSKEKSFKKPIYPIPASSKLINGLPSTTASSILGLGLSGSSKNNNNASKSGGFSKINSRK